MTKVSEAKFRRALLRRTKQTARSGLEDTDPQAPNGRLFQRYGATMYELAFAIDEPQLACPRVLRALAEYRAADSQRGAA